MIVRWTSRDALLQEMYRWKDDDGLGARFDDYISP